MLEGFGNVRPLSTQVDDQGTERDGPYDPVQQYLG
jgi:hypothetical protein